PQTERGMVTGQERLRYHYEAEALVPSGIPVNILLYPMEGDYNAAIAYWLLAYRTGGSFMSVSEDWPGRAHGRHCGEAAQKRCGGVQPFLPGLHLLWVRRHHPAAGTQQDL